MVGASVRSDHLISVSPPPPDLPATLFLLGPPRVLSDAGHAFDLPDALPGYLLAYLGARGDWVLREEPAALLWPDAAAEEAQHNLRVNLNRLRTLLKGWGLADALLAERRRLRLALAVDVDTRRHDGLFLEGLSFRNFARAGEWAQQRRERLRADWREALLKTASTAPPAVVLTLTERLAHDERLAENVQRLRLTALAALGRGDDALREHAAFRDGLQTELDAAPSAAYEAFADRCLAPWRGAAPAPAAAADPTDAFIGRAAELQQARELMARSRLLTLSGLGGVGKTRLARTLLAELAPRFDAGCRWLPLAELGRPAEVLGLLADAVGSATAADRTGLAAVIEGLGSGRWLLAFDNAEHLMDGSGAVPQLIGALLAACPGLQVIVTSREPLGLPAEAVLRLQGLALNSAAVELFHSHARRTLPGFDAARETAAVQRIAQLTGGLPLALRMAAGWLRWLSCAQVADELQRGLDALDAAGAGAVVGVRATLERSWQRLPASAVNGLARLAVFAGPFDPAAARDVADVGLALLAELAEVSMLEPVRDEGAAGHRFQLHPLVRQTALERLDGEHAAGASARAAHRRWLAKVLAPMADWRRVDQRAVLARTGTLIEELRAAWRSAIEHGDAGFIATATPVLLRYFEQKGLWNESIAWFSAPQPQLDPAVPSELAALAALARAQALMLYRKTDLDAAEAVGRRALEWARALGHGEGLKSSLNTMGLTLLMQSRSAAARRHFEEAAALAQADGDSAGEAVFSANIGLTDKRAGDYAAAAAAWQRSLALHRELGNWRSAVNVLSNLGNLLRIEGRFDEAQPLIEEGLRLCDEHGFASTRPFLLINLARLHADAGRSEAAGQLAQATLDDLRSGGEPMLEAASLLVLAQLALRRGDSGSAAPLLARALRSTTNTGDMPNRLEAMDAYGHWLAARGHAEQAAVTWQLLLAHPALHAELRMPLLRQLGPLAAQPPPAGTDLNAWCERASRELERASSG